MTRMKRKRTEPANRFNRWAAFSVKKEVKVEGKLSAEAIVITIEAVDSDDEGFGSLTTTSKDFFSVKPVVTASYG